MRSTALLPSLDALNVTTGVVECSLGSWTYSQCRPAGLERFVDHIWLFDGSLTALRERTFPNGLLEIIVHLGARYRVVEPSGAWTCPVSCVTGVQLGPVLIEAPPERTAVLGLRLKPAGAYAIFARPLHDACDLTVDLRDLAGAAARELEEACGTAPTAAGCLQQAVAWIERRLSRGVRMDPQVHWTMEQIRARRGAVSIATLRERTGMSKTRLSGAFREQVGVTPKQYARIVRFRALLERIHDGRVELAEAAHQAGYYDQPHMNAEFKELSGFTPGQFLSAARYPNSVSIAED